MSINTDALLAMRIDKLTYQKLAALKGAIEERLKALWRRIRARITSGASAHPQR